MRDNPKELQVYRHFKGNCYQVLNIAKHTETEEELVIYRSLYEPQKIYARPLSMFMEEVDRKKYPEAGQKYRFELLTGNETGQAQKAVSANAAERLQEKNEEKPANEQKRPADEQEQSAGNGTVTDSAKADFDGFVIDAELEKFLDEKSYEKKLERLVYLKKKADDEMLNTIAMSLDLELSKSSVEEKYAEILDCLKTLEKYECNRLR